MQITVTAPVTPEVRAEVFRLAITEDRKLLAIKALRVATGAGLLEAKHYVEKVINTCCTAETVDRKVDVPDPTPSQVLPAVADLPAWYLAEVIRYVRESLTV